MLFRSDMVRNMYYNMYFVLSTDPSERIDPDMHLLSVRPVREDFYTVYTPYYSRWSRWNESPKERNEMEYHFEYYQQEDVSIDWEKQQEYLAEAAGWYKNYKQSTRKK